jgi:transposase-like protein
MEATKAPQQRAPRRQWPLVEKRRIVELTQGAGVSVRAIAIEHGVNPNSLHRWKRLYRAGQLDARVKSAPRAPGTVADASFVPVSLVPAVKSLQPITHADVAGRSGIVQVVLVSGSTLRIETGALDAAFVCALVAELQR